MTAVLPLMPLHARAQAQVYPRQHVLEIAHGLESRLRSGTNLPDSTGMLEERLNASTRVAARIRSGQAEFHQNAEDVFFVLSGEATLLSGGTIANPHHTKQEEIRGDSVQGGTSTVMHPGDVVHVPAATPHQVVLQTGTSFLYLVVKVPATK